jgi:hypothetical protein
MIISFSVEPNTIPKGTPVKSWAESAEMGELELLGLNLNKIEAVVGSSIKT